MLVPNFAFKSVQYSDLSRTTKMQWEREQDLSSVKFTIWPLRPRVSSGMAEWMYKGPGEEAGQVKVRENIECGGLRVGGVGVVGGVWGGAAKVRMRARR